MTSIIGSWECENIEVVDNGEKLDKDTVEMMFGEGVSNAFKLAAYDDGLAYVTMMEEEGAVLWSETSDKVYKFSHINFLSLVPRVIQKIPDLWPLSWMERH